MLKIPQIIQIDLTMIMINGKQHTVVPSLI